MTAVVAYGSVAAGSDGEHSDLDLLLVARAGQRNSLWADRDRIASQLLGVPVAWSQQVDWQRPYRFQAWPGSFDVMIDLTIDEGEPHVWRGLVDTHEVVYADEETAARIRRQLEHWSPPDVDIVTMDARAWPWLAYLETNLHHARTWTVRSGLHAFLSEHVVPLLAGRADAIEADLTDEQRSTLHLAAPRSSDQTELARSLRDTALLYRTAIEHLARRSGGDVPDHPMAATLSNRLGRL